MAIQQQIPEIPQTAPDTLQINFYVTVLSPLYSEYLSCTKCETYEQAKELYAKTIDEIDVSETTSILMTINRTGNGEIRTSDLVLARKIKVK